MAMEPLPLMDSDVIYLTVAEFARHAARDGMDAIGAAVRDDIAWHKAHPYAAYRFHKAYFDLLPRWRFLARAWHGWRARRSWAYAKALDPVSCVKAETQRLHPSDIHGPEPYDDPAAKTITDGRRLK